MSSRDNETAAVVARVVTSFDGALLGLGLALAAASSWAKYLTTSTALGRLRTATSSSIADLRSLLSEDEDAGKSSQLVVVRGLVQPRADVEKGFFGSGWWVTSGGGLLSPGSGERAVVIKQTQTCLYNEWRGIFGWSFDLHAIFSKSWKEQRTNSFRSVPFSLVEDGPDQHTSYVHIDMDESDHPLPLTTVYHKLIPVQATPYTLFQAILGNGYPVALLDEEKILPVGKLITAIGICNSRDGSLVLKASQELPVFLTDMTITDVNNELASTSTTLFWSGIFLGVVSAAVLGYSVCRNWSRLKEWMARRRQVAEIQANALAQGETDEEYDEVPDGQLCVVCLTRRRMYAFIPCGHLTCCERCVMDIERYTSPECPMCRQSIRSSIKIFNC